MNLNPVLLAIPVYFTLMGAELVYEAVTRRRTYRLNDAVTNINLGALDQLTGTFTQILKVGVYTVVYEQLRLMEIPDTGWSFIILFVFWDLCYYWSHRMAHEVSLFWGGHVVHHQSEEFNLSVALRQSSTSFLWSIPFYLPLAVLGFSPVHFLLAGGLNLLYQFWIHTEHIKRLGPLEWVMNTPSHHRVHHGRDPKYLDRNYAGVFIVWDRLFGTFQDEEERPHYGITTPLASWNPLYANLAHYMALARSLRHVRSLGDGMRMVFGPPGWRPDYMGGPVAPPPIADDSKYDASVPASARTYLTVQFLALMMPVAFYLFESARMAGVLKASFALWIVLSTILFGFLFESRHPGVRMAETARLLCLLPGIWWLQQAGLVPPSIWPLVAVAGFVATSTFHVWRHYSLEGTT